MKQSMYKIHSRGQLRHGGSSATRAINNIVDAYFYPRRAAKVRVWRLRDIAKDIPGSHVGVQSTGGLVDRAGHHTVIRHAPQIRHAPGTNTAIVRRGMEMFRVELVHVEGRDGHVRPGETVRRGRAQGEARRVQTQGVAEEDTCR
jgi:hypothetical protein